MHRVKKRSAVVIAAALSIGLLASSPAAADVTYTYDALGRLATASDSSSGLTIIYSYDAAGNRTSKAVVTTTLWGHFNWNGANWT